MKISYRLAGSVVAALLVAFALATWSIDRTVRAALLERSTSALEGLRASRVQSAELYFDRLSGGVRIASQGLGTGRFMAQLPVAYTAIRTDGRPRLALEKLYADSIEPRMMAAGYGPDEGARPDALSPAAAALQTALLGRDPASLRSVAAWRGLTEFYRAGVEEYMHTFGWSDVYLVDPNGTVLYAYDTPTVLGTNLRSGPFQRSGLASAFEAVAASPRIGQTVIVDYARFEPAFGALSAFVAAPVVLQDDGTIRGVVVARVGTAELDGIMTKPVGSKGGARSYLVGSDPTVRTPDDLPEGSRASDASTLAPVRLALAGGTGTIRHRGAGGADLISSYGPVDVRNVRWAVVAQTDVDDVMTPVRAVRERVLLFFLATSMVAVLLLTSTLQKTVFGPLRAIGGAVERIRGGDLAYEVPLPADDEIGELGQSVVGTLRTTRSDLTRLEQDHEKLQSLEQLRHDLVHMVVHDMRSPLVVLGASLRFLQQDVTDAAMLEDLREAARAASQVNRMANDLLDVTRLEEGKLPLQAQPIELVALAGQVQASLAVLDPARRIDVAALTPVLVLCDPDLIRRVIENLVGNAIKHTPAGGHICISVERRGAVARVAVHDEGPGIPPAARSQVFEKFGGITARQARGFHSAGLGLAFCKLAVEAHGGTIGVDAGIPAGSVFWFELPDRV